MISPAFLNSDFCYQDEMLRALDRHENDEACVIPIILRPVDWQGSPFEKLQALPKDAKPVSAWANRDEAWLDVAQGIRSAVERLAAAPKRRPLPSHLASLRRPVVGFVARRDENGDDILSQLTAALAPRSNQTVALWGPGGVGKTTLAVETVLALADEFERRVVWTGPQQRTDFGFTTLLDEIAAQLGHADLRTLALAPKTEAVQSLLAEAAALVVLDNFETVVEAEQTRCAEWLGQDAPCAALITTRGRIANARNLKIAAMSGAEAREFLARLINETRDPKVFAALDHDRIIRTAEANPLILQWIVAQVDDAQEPQTVLDELAQGAGDAAERVFGRSFNLPQVGEDGRAALVALSLFTPSASRASLAEVAGFGGDAKRLDEAVKRLYGLWLIGTREGHRRLTIEGLTRQLARARLAKHPQADEFHRRFIAHFLSYAQAHNQVTPEDLDALESEKNNVLGAIDLAEQIKDWESVMQLSHSLLFPTGSFPGILLIRGHWDEALRCGRQAIVAALNSEDEMRVAQFSHNVAVIHQDRGEVEEARQFYERSLEIVKKFNAQGGIASTLHQLGRLAQDLGELDEAKHLYEQSLEIKEKLGVQSGIATTMQEQGILAADQGELEQAQKLFEQSLEISIKLDNRISIATILHNLAVLAANQGERETARRLYEQSLEVKNKLGDQNGIAITLHNLGALAEEDGDKAEAARLFREALADSVILSSESEILHAEFQTTQKSRVPLPLRMLDYYVGFKRQKPKRRVRQAVIVLKETRAPIPDRYEDECTSHRYDVIRMWEQDPQELLKYEGLLPLATLCRAESGEKLLAEVAARINRIESREQRRETLGLSRVLAGVRYDRNLIYRIFKESDMLEESVVYQDILQKGAERGFRRLRNLVMGQLDQLLGKLSAKTRKQVEELSIEQLEELGKALLKFKSEKDLTAWLKQRAATH